MPSPSPTAKPGRSPNRASVFKPKFVDGKVEVDGGATFGPEADSELEVLYGSVEVGPAEFFRVKFSLAVRLLRSNYDLTDAELAELLVLDTSDEASRARWEQFGNAMMGVVPKLSPAF